MADDTRGLIPDSEAALSDVIRSTSGALRASGGGTRVIDGGQCQEISTTGLTGVSLYEPGALTLVAKAGTPLSEVEATLAAENQRLPFEPWRFGGASTIGGVVATNASGPRRIQAGACRDSLIGVRFVDGTGEIIKNGGRVMKNVTGYDLVKLMAGSWGTLGILTEVSFKVLPGVETTSTLVVHGLDDIAAVQAMSQALGSPFDVSGAAHVPGAEAKTYIRLEGFAGAVSYRTDALKDSLGAFGDVTVVEGAGPWAALRDANAMDGSGDLWRISVKPSDAPALVARIAPSAVQYDWGGGLIWLRTEGPVRKHMANVQGHATLLKRAQSKEPAFHPEDAGIAVLSRGIRAKFDPNGRLNPGLMG